jgi:hypothetical protein
MRTDELVALQFPPVSYKNPSFRQRDCSAAPLIYADFLLGLFLEPEDAADTFLRNVG